MEVTIIKDKEELERQEGIIDKCLQEIQKLTIEGAQALRHIRVNQLYEKVRGISNFETYCKERWGFTIRRAEQMIAYAKVLENTNNCSPISITTESQTRPLTKLDPTQQRIAWAKAVETAPEGKVTAAHVAKVVKEFTKESRREDEGGKEEENKNEEKEENKKEQPQKKGDGNKNIPEHAVHFVIIAISHLERIKPDDPSRERAFSKLKEWIRKNE